jgi:HSP20 family protein
MQVLKVNNNPVHRTAGSVFDEFFNELPSFVNKEWNNSNFPPVNIHETKDAYLLELNVPGRLKEDFEINVENGILTISYEKKEKNKQEEFRTVRREFVFRNFKCNFNLFNLDDNIDTTNIQAKYENGLLKLFVPRKEQEKNSGRQISID